MLECRTYSYAELSALLHTRDRQGIVRRFERWEVKYTTTGRGTGQKFAITEIGNPFKVYCILDLGFSPQTDFTKLAFFTYYLLCDDEFQQLPSAQMEEYLRADGHTLSRQTISNYLLCLEAASLICRGFDYPNRDFSRNAEEDAAERPRAALERQPAFQHTPHCESGGEEMKIDNTAQEKRKKKKQQTQLE